MIDYSGLGNRWRFADQHKQERRTRNGHKEVSR
jgi:hypothetical protein